MPARGGHARYGAAVLVALAHVLFVIALLRFAGMTGSRTDDVPAEQVAFAFIPLLAPAARAPAAVTPKVQAPPVTVRSMAVPVVRRPRAVTADPGPAPPADSTPPVPQASEAPPLPALTGRLDMAALRASARQVESERVPTARERVRESEQMRASDDSDFSRAVRGAKRPDCQTKYSGGTSVDVFRLIPLAIDTITDTGCKW